MRGVWLWQMLISPFSEASIRFRGLGDNSKDCACAFKVLNVDYFVSHAWASSWISKQLALLYHFNANLATICTVAAATAAFYVENMLPQSLVDADTWRALSWRSPSWPTWIPRLSEVDGAPHLVPHYSYYTASLLFPLFLWLLSVRLRTRVFLDSCCVVQHDRAQKAAGIASLGAIVSRSERLLVLVDEHTFTRVHAQLWAMPLTLDAHPVPNPQPNRNPNPPIVCAAPSRAINALVWSAVVCV